MKETIGNLISAAEADRDFFRVLRMVDEGGAVVITEDNAPRYLVVEFASSERAQAADEDVMAVSRRLIEKNHAAYEVLAR